MTRARSILGIAVAFLLAPASLFAADPPAAAAASRPNVILIMTDDQGFGDFSGNGNPHIQTPNMDRLSKDGVTLTSFYVSPVCTPTRANLMTGRYNYRTCAIDTAYGRAMMHPDEVTLAEHLRAAGYRTGIFGKWHLGDLYPMRSIDQGFEESLVHRGGGIGQPSDPPGGSNYTNPILEHNGKLEQFEGYCSDVYTDAALSFIKSHAEDSFFVYLAYNCPHGPLLTPEKPARDYSQVPATPQDYPAVGQPIGKMDAETTRRIYAMVENVDMNLGRLFGKLDEWKLAENTIVIFLTDNGPQQPRYNAGMRERKGSVYEGGIHVPCYVRWPARLKAGTQIKTVAAHYDLTPTILAACGAKPIGTAKLDGVNLLPLLTGEVQTIPERYIFSQWHRGEIPDRYRAFMVRGPRWKLVQAKGSGDGAFDSKNPPPFELYDILADPFEMKNVAADHADIVATMKAAYDAWFDDVCSTRGFAPAAIQIGTEHSPSVDLTRQDWRGPQSNWSMKGKGHWETEVAAGHYDLEILLLPQPLDRVIFTAGELRREVAVPAGAKSVSLSDIELPVGKVWLQCWGEKDGQSLAIHQVRVTRKK